ATCAPASFSREAPAPPLTGGPFGTSPVGVIQEVTCIARPVAETLRGAPSQEQARGRAGHQGRDDAGHLGPRARPRLAPNRHPPLRERRNVRAVPLLPGLRLGFAVLHLR